MSDTTSPAVKWTYPKKPDGTKDYEARVRELVRERELSRVAISQILGETIDMTPIGATFKAMDQLARIAKHLNVRYEEPKHELYCTLAECEDLLNDDDNVNAREVVHDILYDITGVMYRVWPSIAKDDDDGDEYQDGTPTVKRAKKEIEKRKKKEEKKA